MGRDRERERERDLHARKFILFTLFLLQLVAHSAKSCSQTNVARLLLVSFPLSLSESAQQRQSIAAMVALTATTTTTTLAYFPGHTYTGRHTREYFFIFATDKKSGNTKAKLTLSTKRMRMWMQLKDNKLHTHAQQLSHTHFTNKQGCRLGTRERDNAKRASKKRASGGGNWSSLIARQM